MLGRIDAVTLTPGTDIHTNASATMTIVERTTT
jgi:hypothetical protein